MAYPAHSGFYFVDTIRNDIYAAIDPTRSDLSQPSKVVLITGAGRGIGRSIALRYAESGVACIVLCARTSSELDEVEQDIYSIGRSIRVCKISLDVTDELQVLAAAQTVKKKEDRLDVLVNNAGTSNKWAPLAESDPSNYWRAWEVNFKASYLMLKAFLPLLTETAKKTDTVVDVINMSSIGAQFLVPEGSACQVSKFALCRLSEFVMVEYGAHGVNCVALHPGAVLTKLSSTAPPVVKASLIDTADLAGGFVPWLTKGRRTWLNGRYVSATWDADELEAKKEEIVGADKLKFRMVV